MLAAEFSKQIMALLPTLNRVARAQFERQIDAEDAVLEAVAKAWEKRGQLREERYFNTWVVRILINVCRDAQRKEQHEVLHEAPGEGPGEAMEREQADGEPSEGTCEGPGEMAALEREEDERLWLGEGDERLHAALFSLDEQTRVTLVLFYVEGYGPQEIGRLLGIRPGTVRSRLSRGRAKLRAAWAAQTEVAER